MKKLIGGGGERKHVQSAMTMRVELRMVSNCFWELMKIVFDMSARCRGM